MPGQWNIKIDVKLGGEEWNFDLTSGEQGLLTMLRASWPVLEQKVRVMLDTRPGELKHGLVDDALVLLRCLVMNRLEQHKGSSVNISRV